jgi:capsular polysaccharide transport system ATP-binding protein
VIIISHVSHSAGGKLLLNDINLRINHGDRVGILASSGGGKTTLARILSGARTPDTGRVWSDATLSWPLTYSPILNSQLTVSANITMIALMRGLDPDRIIAQTIALLGSDTTLHQRIADLSPGGKLQIIVSLTLAMRFDFYLADEMPSLAVSPFRDRFEYAFEQRLTQSGLILLTRHAHLLKSHCHSFYALCEGRLIPCESAQNAKDIVEYSDERTAQHVSA